MKKKWNKTNLVVILLLIVLWPAGLFFMWVETSWDRKIKWGVTAVFATLFLLGFGIIANAKPTAVLSQQEETNTTAITVQPTTAPPTNTPKPTVQTTKAPTNTPKPTIKPTAVSKKITEKKGNLSEEEQVELLVTQQLKGENNLEKKYLREIRVTEQIDGGWGIFAAFNANDNLTTNLRKAGIEKKMSEIYIALYTSKYDIKQAGIVAYFPLVDQYGNETEGVVYKSFLDKVEADEVNWEADEVTLQLQILPDIWETTNLHPEFR